jgi:ferrochelatase
LRRRLSIAAEVTVGMRYGEPSISTALSDLCSRGCARLLVLPLYPQYSGTTNGSAIDSVTRELSSRRRIPELRTVVGYSGHHAYIEALTESLRESRRNEHAHLLMSFHGIPTRYAEAGDPYPSRCDETARLLAESLQLPPERWTRCYQSRFGRGEWLGPATGDVLNRMGLSGTRELDVVCPGFAADCLETLEEIAVTGRDIYESAGGSGFHYVPALNDSDRHVHALAAIIGDHVAGWEEPKALDGK